MGSESARGRLDLIISFILALHPKAGEKILKKNDFYTIFYLRFLFVEKKKRFFSCILNNDIQPLLNIFVRHCHSSTKIPTPNY